VFSLFSFVDHLQSLSDYILANKSHFNPFLTTQLQSIGQFSITLTLTFIFVACTTKKIQIVTEIVTEKFGNCDRKFQFVTEIVTELVVTN